MKNIRPVQREILSLLYKQSLELLKRCAISYYGEDESLVPDGYFDALKQQVNALEVQFLEDPNMKHLVDPWKNTRTFYLHCVEEDKHEEPGK